MSETSGMIHESPIDVLDKGVPFATGGRGRLNVLAGDLHFPLMVLKESALAHNIGAMADWCQTEGLLLAPHGKTTMCPRIFERQLAAGAWGMTVAHASQAVVGAQSGVRRLVIANQVVDRAAVGTLAALQRMYPTLELYSLVDSVDSVRILAEHLQGAQSERPVNVFLEWGQPHWRTGVRSREQALRVHNELERQEQWVRLAGVECFEGLAHGSSTDEEAQQVGAFINEAIGLLEELQAASRYPLIFSTGGSSFLDRVSDCCRALRGRFSVVLRSGCYVTHDHGQYQKRMESAMLRGGPLRVPQFLPALELWSAVQSIPDPDLAILTFGKRDCPYDLGLPLPLFTIGPGGRTSCEPQDVNPAPHSRLPLPTSRVKQLNDQHAFLSDPPAGLRVGDLVCCGISHPCTAFDKWRAIPLVDDDYNVIDWYRTFF